MRDAVGAILPAGTLLRRVELTGAWTDVTAVAVPARDEVNRIGACVESLKAAEALDGRPLGAVVLVNNS